MAANGPKAAPKIVKIPKPNLIEFRNRMRKIDLDDRQ